VGGYLLLNLNDPNAPNEFDDMTATLMYGNEAIGAGAIRAGCNFFAGYPITPQNELFEYMASQLPLANGIFLQSESELAGINMVYGAAAGGGRCMTSSSGPGFTLMGEGLTTLATARMPAVIVCVSRAGPGLGRIASSQSDYRLATRGGGHGDYRCLVLGPAGVQELYELTYEAFVLAEKYANPVIVLSDAILGQMMEPVELDRLPQLTVPVRERTARGRGAGPRRVIKVAPYTDEELIDWNRHLKQKYGQMSAAEQRSELIYAEQAEAAVVAFGSSARIALDAVVRARADGLPVALFRPISLFPFPAEALRAMVTSGTGRFLVVEANNGQMIEDVRAAVGDGAAVSHYGVGGGHIFTPDEIHSELTEWFERPPAGATSARLKRINSE
jgi:2-oxoglutarate ferredoxin oxidoreductase subunit alpha